MRLVIGSEPKLSNFIAVAATLTTLLVTPLASYDPINVPRIVSLSLFAFIGLVILIIGRNWYRDSIKSGLLPFFLIFNLWMLISTFISNYSMVERFFGVAGRQTGILTYFSLSALGLIASLVSGKILILRLILGLSISGLISAIYGVIQSFGADPFDWINPYSPVFGLFGNPNFQASFMGITAVVFISIFMNNDIKSIHRFIAISFVPINLYVIWKSQSQQGFLVFAIGAFVLVGFVIRSRISYLRIYLICVIISLVFIVLDILQKAPWSSILFKESVSARGDYWRSAFRMANDNPIFGIGMDGYRDYYRFYRDQAAVARDSDGMVDSAHNVFLDLATGGGYPLFIIYLVFIILVFLSIYRIIRSNQENIYPLAGVISAWIGLLAQSVISINQIGLAIWIWILGGAIIGFEKQMYSQESKVFLRLSGVKFFVACLSGLTISLFVVMPLYRADVQFREYMKIGEVTKIKENLYKWPQSPVRMTLAATIIREGGFPNESLEISQAAAIEFPKNFEVWEEIARNPSASIEVRKRAVDILRKLDPLNPNVLKLRP